MSHLWAYFTKWPCSVFSFPPLSFSLSEHTVYSPITLNHPQFPNTCVISIASSPGAYHSLCLACPFPCRTCSYFISRVKPGKCSFLVLIFDTTIQRFLHKSLSLTKLWVLRTEPIIILYFSLQFQHHLRCRSLQKCMLNG